MFSMSSVNLLWPYTYITAISSRKAIRVRPVAPKLKIENQGEPSGAEAENPNSVSSRWEQIVQRQDKCSLMMLGTLCLDLAWIGLPPVEESEPVFASPSGEDCTNAGKEEFYIITKCAILLKLIQQ